MRQPIAGSVPAMTKSALGASFLDVSEWGQSMTVNKTSDAKHIMKWSKKLMVEQVFRGQ
ncbi:MAG: hypothetical protein K1X66_07810 [Verrucomicrobiae bacterium]|nr:hypothetical protein [Verrucomicrobiae bacterium]